MTMTARLVLYNRGIAVPDEISIVGFDDISLSQYMVPPPTTVRQPAYYMGLAAAQAMLGGEQLHLPDIPLELVVRQSVAIRRSFCPG
jgi:LacI family transcriptional regulator